MIRGTSIQLQIRSRFAKRLLDPVAIARILQQYCPYIPTPYFINLATLPLNHDAPPWEEPDDPTLAESYLQDHFRCSSLVDFYVHRDGPVTLQDPPFAGETIPELRLSGYFAIPDRLSYDSSRLKVYTSGLYVGDLDKAMPRWATFLLGGIESPDIDLTLGRDSVMRDSRWAAVRQIVRNELIQQIVSSLQDKKSRLRETWNAVFHIHEQNIKIAAVEDAKSGSGDFFSSVKDLVPFAIGTERLSIRQAIGQGKALEKEGKRTLFYLAHGFRPNESAGIQEQLLFAEAELSFVNARNFYDRDFIHEYAKTDPDLNLVPVEAGVEYLLDFETDMPLRTLVNDIYASVNLRARLCKFRPGELSAVIVLVTGSKPARMPKTRQELSELILGHASPSQNLPYTLCLNQENRLVQALLSHASKHGVDSHLRAAFRQIYYMAVLVFGDRNTEIIAGMAPGLAHLMLGFIRRATLQEEEMSRLRALIATGDNSIAYDLDDAQPELATEDQNRLDSSDGERAREGTQKRTARKKTARKKTARKKTARKKTAKKKTSH